MNLGAARAPAWRTTHGSVAKFIRAWRLPTQATWCQSRKLRPDSPHVAQPRVAGSNHRSKASYLLAHPALGRLGRVAGTRELVAHQNYILVHDLAGDSLRILRVLHAARQWP